MSELTDQQLVAKYLKGDQQALETLIARYLGGIYNFVFKYVRNQQSAEDVTQEAMLKMWKNVKRYNPKFKFSTWMFTIAKNTALDHLRSRGLQPVADLADQQAYLLDYQAVPENEYEKLADMQMLGLKISQLPEKYANVLDLYYKKGFNFREIADLLSESINTIKTRHRRAVAELKKQISGE